MILKGALEKVVPDEDESSLVVVIKEEEEVEEMSHLTLGNPVVPWGTEELRRALLDRYMKKYVKPYFYIDNDDHVREAFSHFVLQVPMIVDGCSVLRKAWAKAFYETDMIDSAKCLFEALFTEEEMRDCTLNGKNGTGELNPMKMLAILRAAKWMSNKYRDPYSFSPNQDGHNVYPSKEEQEKIEKKVFTERRSQSNRKNKKRQLIGDKHHLSMKQHMDVDYSPGGGELFIHLDDGGGGGELFDSKSAASSPGGSGGSEGSPYSSCGSDRDRKICIGGLPPSYEELNVVAFSKLDPLQVAYMRYAEEFVDTLFPNWEDKYVFIDGMLVDKDKWKKAFDEGSDPVKSAWTLFLAMFSDEEIIKCTLNGKNNTTELCPVKKLAIIRAVEWMKQMQPSTSSTLDIPIPKIWEKWDNDCGPCNLFPSKEDKEKIETKVFTEKRYQQSRQLQNQNSSSLSTM